MNKLITIWQALAAATLGLGVGVVVAQLGGQRGVVCAALAIVGFEAGKHVTIWVGDWMRERL